MTKQFNGKIALDVRDSEPDWDPYLAPQAPEGAPNVLFLAWDDLGYATMDTFGGPVKCPNMARIADRGVKFANFHTTALCSPTRASLLTGRNATSNGMATIAEFASGFPGISTRIPFENGFISEVLAQQGYNTYCVGKWHLTPGEECNVAAYKGRWPLGRGFERFYGWLGGETNSYFPDLVHDNHPIEPPGRPEDGYHLADDMADMNDLMTRIIGRDDLSILDDAIHAADLNEDGYPEIISWSWANDASGYYENLTGRAAISGFCFHDGNQNGVFDADEQPLRGVPVLLEPAGLVAYSDAAGRYRFNVPPGDYTLEASNHYCWERIVDSTYILTLAEEPIQGPDIGYAAGNSQAGLIATVAMAPLRCTEIVPAWVLVENPNCTAAPGMVEVVLDDLLTFVSATPLPEAIAGDTLIWDLDSIPAAQSRSIYLEVQAADANYAGEVTNISAQINPLIGPGDPLVSKLYVAVDTIRCSYDPNDKLVNLRYVPIDYLPVEHELVYTLRFQNTGNDTAFSVRLRDTLSANLNWPTLRPLGSSHAYYTVFDTETGLLEFVFDNILLPDSTADERGSHGFVQFAVQLLAGLPPGTVVPNGAGIYFDANPVVLTNTVETQVVDPVSTHAPQEPRALNVYPNPGSGYFRVRFDRPANGQLSVRDAMGRLLLSRKIPAGTAEASIGLSGYPGGIYWILWSEEGMKPAAARIILQ